MATTKVRQSTRNAMAQVIVDALDAGSGPSLLKFYTGAMPASPETAITDQVLLGTLTCSDPSASVTDGTITFAAITQDDAADAGGTVTWARHCDSTGAAVIDHDVTNEAGTGAIKLNTVTVVQGGPIRMNSYVINLGGK